MSEMTAEIRGAPHDRLTDWLRGGYVDASAGEPEQRHCLFEVAVELARQHGTQLLVDLLDEGALPPQSLGGVIEACAGALRDERVRKVVWRYLDSPADEYVLTSALRALGSHTSDSRPLATLLNRSRDLLTHRSPLVRLAALELLVRQGQDDPTALLLQALRDRDAWVRREALDLADDLASEGRLDTNSRREILAHARKDKAESVRHFATTRSALVDQA